jgi:hypothetical protein
MNAFRGSTLIPATAGYVCLINIGRSTMQSSSAGGMTMTIEIDALVLEALQKLKVQADERRLPLHQYLNQLAEMSFSPDSQDISAEEIDAVFEE